MLKGRHTAKTCVCRVSVFGTRQNLVFAVCLTSAHGKDNVVQHLLGSGTRGCIFAVCCPEAHGKDRCSPCAVPWHTSNLDGVVRQPTTVSGSPRGTSFAVCRKVGTWRRYSHVCPILTGVERRCLCRALTLGTRQTQGFAVCQTQTHGKHKSLLCADP